MSTRFEKVLANVPPAPEPQEEPKEPKPKRFPVVVQKWEETERGWGCRPDGWTMHLTEEDRAAFVKAYWDSMPDGPAPDEYTRTSGSPYIMDVDEETYKKVEASDKHGIWGPGNMPPAVERGDAAVTSVMCVSRIASDRVQLRRPRPFRPRSRGASPAQWREWR